MRILSVECFGQVFAIAINSGENVNKHGIECGVCVQRIVQTLIFWML